MHIVYHMAVTEMHTHEHAYTHTCAHTCTQHTCARARTHTTLHFIMLRFLNPWSLITCFSTCIGCKAVVGLQGQVDPVLIQVWIHHTNILPLLVSVTAD